MSLTDLLVSQTVLNLCVLLQPTTADHPRSKTQSSLTALHLNVPYNTYKTMFSDTQMSIFLNLILP